MFSVFRLKKMQAPGCWNSATAADGSAPDGVGRSEDLEVLDVGSISLDGHKVRERCLNASCFRPPDMISC
jgi:hypothetical protein